MNVKINSIPTELPEGTTIADVAAAQQLPDKGVAVAVNNEMVARDGWAAHVVKNGDDIVILKAFCGG